MRARTTTACWASRRFILGVLAIQRVDGPSLAMLTHPSNQSNSQGMTRPSPLCSVGRRVRHHAEDDDRGQLQLAITAITASNLMLLFRPAQM